MEALEVFFMIILAYSTGCVVTRCMLEDRSDREHEENKFKKYPYCKRRPRKK